MSNPAIQAKQLLAERPDVVAVTFLAVNVSFGLHNQAVPERTCIGCGCTDSHACPEGCSWPQADVDLCSACFDDGLAVELL